MIKTQNGQSREIGNIGYTRHREDEDKQRKKAQHNTEI